jgi:peptide/nickel transport system permease protein
VLSYTIRRLLIFIPTLFLLSILLFLGLEAGPGDAASYLINPEIPSDQIERMREEMGLNRPLPVRYVSWVNELLHGNLGYSMLDGASVRMLLANRVPRTLYLMALALVMAVTFGLLFGVISALHQYSIVDNAFTFIGLLGISTPAFFTGMLGILLFALKWRLVPIGGVAREPNFWLALRHAILPASVLAFRSGSEFLRYTRGAMLDALNKDYIALAKSKGLTVRRVTYVHGLRTALIPVATIIILRLPALVGGSVIVEQVFAWPGMGTMMITASRGQDFPVVMVVALLIGGVLLCASLLADILLAIIDPRVRLG